MRSIKNGDSVFARLVRTAGLRDPATLAYSSGETDARLHLQLWLEWLTLSLKVQLQQIQDLLSAAGESELLLMAGIYRAVADPRFIPEGATEPERLLFLNDFEFCMGLILGASAARSLDAPSPALPRPDQRPLRPLPAC